MADEEIREKIKDALRNGPLTAVDIAKKIGKDKKDINRVVYKMVEVESIKAAKGPPLWKLKSTTSDSATDSTPSSTSTVDPTPPSATPVSSAGATPIKESSKTDHDLKERINQLLTTDPQSAPDILRKLNDASVAMSDVKNILYNFGIAENTAPAGQKPLYVKKGFKKPTKLQHDGGPVYTKKETNDGTISFVPLTDTDIKSSSTGGKGGKEEEEVKSKLDVSSQKSPDSAPSPSNGSSCHPPTDGISSLSLDDNNLKDAVLKHMKDNKEKCFKAGDLMETLGQTTRDGIMYCLKELAKEGKIEENNDGTFKALSNEN